MKKYIFMICLWVYMVVTPVYASSPLLYNLECLDENRNIIIDCTELSDYAYGDYQKDKGILSYSFDINNLLSYDVMLVDCQIKNLTSVNLSYTLKTDTKEIKGHSQDKTFIQDIQNFFLQQKIISQQTVSFLLQYEITQDTQPVFYFQLTFKPITLQGYIYQVHKEDSFFYNQLSVKLWQDKNLVATAYTNEQGYYQFSYPMQDNKYTLEVNHLDNVDVIKKGETSFWKKQQTSFYSKAITSQDSTQNYDLKLTTLSYRLLYDANGGEGILVDNQNPYAIDSQIILPESIGIIKEGCTFKGWCEHIDGSSTIYQPLDRFIMPSHDVTFYAIWQNNQVQETPKEKNISYASVQTSDETSITLSLLLLLVSITGIIVMKSLKKK